MLVTSPPPTSTGQCFAIARRKPTYTYKTPSSPNSEHTYLKTVVRPAAKLHYARLLIERKVLDVDFARTLVDGRRPPVHASRIVERCLGGERHFEIAVRTGGSEHIHKSTACARCGVGGLWIICRKQCIRVGIYAGSISVIMFAVHYITLQYGSCLQLRVSIPAQ